VRVVNLAGVILARSRLGHLGGTVSVIRPGMGVVHVACRDRAMETPRMGGCIISVPRRSVGRLVEQEGHAQRHPGNSPLNPRGPNSPCLRADGRSWGFNSGWQGRSYLGCNARQTESPWPRPVLVLMRTKGQGPKACWEGGSGMGGEQNRTLPRSLALHKAYWMKR